MSQYILVNNKTIMEVSDGYLESKIKEWESKGIKAEKVKNPPTTKTLEKWMDQASVKATDGCKVDPDGHCRHGKPSWLLAMGLI